MNAVADRIESEIQRLVQDWVADPLQFCGVDLDKQVRGCLIVLAVGWIVIGCVDAARRWWFVLAFDGVMIPAYLHMAVNGMNGPHKAAVASFRYDGLYWLGLTILMTPTGFSDLRVRIWCVTALALALRHYLLRAKPKPPAGNLKLAEDNG